MKFGALTQRILVLTWNARAEYAARKRLERWRANAETGLAAGTSATVEARLPDGGARRQGVGAESGE